MVFGRAARLLMFAAAAALLGLGCTPSVRYTRGQPPPPREQPAKDRPAPVPARAAADEDDGSSWGPDEYRDGRKAPPKEQTAKAKAKAKDDRRRDKVIRPAPNILEQVANSYLGTPYKYGGMTRKGMDCSGFVTLVFREAYNRELPRSSGRMWKEGSAVAVSAARQGDLVFFRRSGPAGAVDHVGIYMGKNRFIHASTSRGVIYSDLNEEYYAKRFAGVRRVM